MGLIRGGAEFEAAVAAGFGDRLGDHLLRLGREAGLADIEIDIDTAGRRSRGLRRVCALGRVL